MGDRRRPIREFTERHFKNPFEFIAGRDLAENENESLQVGVSYDFLSGIVADVISNPYEFLRRKYGDTEFLLKDVISGRIAFPDEEINKNLAAAGNFVNPNMVDLMPANSIFAYIIDDNQSSDDPKMTICYPFFPSHLSLPLNPGEYVWIISEDVKGVTYYYWMCRKVSPRHIEDANYSNYERLVAVNDILDVHFAQGGNLPASSFDEAYTLDEQRSRSLQTQSEQGYVKNKSNFPIPMSSILKNSYAYNMEFTGEPVPRISKKCGDVVIQGSNNSGIHLTTEKFSDEDLIDKSVFYSGNGDENSEPPPQRKPHSAAVDIFVSRKKSSLDFLAASQTPEASLQNQESKIKVSRNNGINEYFNYIENNKLADVMTNDLNVYDNELNDTLTDATDVGARMYMSHQCSVDNTFGSNFDVLTSYYGPSIVTYAQHNRVVGASDVRLASLSGQSFIDLDPNGNIVAKASHGNGQQFLSLGNDGVSRLQAQDKIELAVRGNNEEPKEPYVLYSELKVILDKILSNLLVLNDLYIDNIGNTFATATGTSTAATAAGQVPTPAGPGLTSDTGLDEFVNAAVSTAMAGLVAPAKQNAQVVTNETVIASSDASRTGTPLRSSKIFGE